MEILSIFCCLEEFCKILCLHHGPICYLRKYWKKGLANNKVRKCKPEKATKETEKSQDYCLKN